MGGRRWWWRSKSAVSGQWSAGQLGSRVAHVRVPVASALSPTRGGAFFPCCAEGGAVAGGAQGRGA